MNDIIRLTKENEVYFKAHLNREQYLEFRTFLSHYADNYKFQPMFKSGMWDGKIYFVDKFGRFPIGLLGKFLEFCNRFKYDCSFDFPENDFGEKISDEVLSNYFDIHNKFSLCDHQTTNPMYFSYNLKSSLDCIYKTTSVPRKIPFLV